MTRSIRPPAMALISAAFASILIVLFLWIGPGANAFQSVSRPVLFDEEQIVSLFRRVSPAVVEVQVRESLGGFSNRNGTGSGFVIDTDGHIATNNHVVDDATNVNVRFADGRTVNAEVLGRDPANDLALLKVSSSDVEGIVPLVLGDSTLVEPGQLALAIGSPYGLEGSVSAGIISGINRDLPSTLNRPIAGIVQTDAAIFPGNSGGPLLNSRGEVVGVNTAIQVWPLGQQVRSIGFAVPVDTLKERLPQLMTREVLRPAWLGIAAVSIDRNLVDSLDLPVDEGVYVTLVVPDSPSGDAGLIEAGRGSLNRPARGGDIITEIAGVPVTSVPEVVARLNNFSPGDTVTVTVIRDEQTLSVEVTLGEWPESTVEVREEFPLDPFERLPRIFPRR